LHSGFDEIEAAQRFIQEVTEGYYAERWGSRNIGTPADAGQEYKAFQEWFLKEAAKTTLTGKDVIAGFYSIMLDGSTWVVTVLDAEELLTTGDVDLDPLTVLRLGGLARRIPLARSGKLRLVDKKGKFLKEFDEAALNRMAKQAAERKGMGDWHEFYKRRAGDPALKGLNPTERNAKLRQLLREEQEAKLAAAQKARAAQAPKRAVRTRLEKAQTIRDSRGELCRALHDPQGRQVRIYGQAERGSSKTLGHTEAMNNQVERMVESGEYERVYIQRNWKTATGESGASTNIPDVIGVRHNGKVDAFEVRSSSQTVKELDTKLEKDLRLLPAERRGTYRTLEPEPPAP
jgi:hypothetical protein